MGRPLGHRLELSQPVWSAWITTLCYQRSLVPYSPAFPCPVLCALQARACGRLASRCVPAACPPAQPPTTRAAPHTGRPPRCTHSAPKARPLPTSCHLVIPYTRQEDDTTTSKDEAIDTLLLAVPWLAGVAYLAGATVLDTKASPGVGPPRQRGRRFCSATHPCMPAGACWAALHAARPAVEHHGSAGRCSPRACWPPRPCRCPSTS